MTYPDWDRQFAETPSERAERQLRGRQLRMAADQKAMGESLRDTLVRFGHERNGGPVYSVMHVAVDGMIELNGMAGQFAPHLFVVADDIGGVPPSRHDLKCPGVGRDKDNARALQFYFSRTVTDDEMRFLHEVMQRAVACMPESS